MPPLGETAPRGQLFPVTEGAVGVSLGLAGPSLWARQGRGVVMKSPSIALEPLISRSAGAGLVL